MSLKKRTFKALSWSFFESILRNGSNFLIGIFLARILDPDDFGIFALAYSIISILHIVIEGGFSQYVIRKKDANQRDFSTLFYSNLIVSIFLYLILLLVSEALSIFIGSPVLKLLIKILGINLILYSLSIVHRTILSKKLEFKLIANITVFSSISSGIISIYLALNNYELWSLVYRNLCNYLLLSVLFWVFNSWRPSIIFCKNSFKQMFNFGYKLIISSFILNAYNGLFNFIIGVKYSISDLGFLIKLQNLII